MCEVTQTVDGVDPFFWDHKPCPADGCDGELQQQDRMNVTCLTCEEVWNSVINAYNNEIRLYDTYGDGIAAVEPLPGTAGTGEVNV